MDADSFPADFAWSGEAGKAAEVVAGAEHPPADTDTTMASANTALERRVRKLPHQARPRVRRSAGPRGARSVAHIVPGVTEGIMDVLWTPFAAAHVSRGDAGHMCTVPSSLMVQPGLWATSHT